MGGREPVQLHCLFCAQAARQSTLIAFMEGCGSLPPLSPETLAAAALVGCYCPDLPLANSEGGLKPKVRGAWAGGVAGRYRTTLVSVPLPSSAHHSKQLLQSASNSQLGTRTRSNLCL